MDAPAPSNVFGGGGTFAGMGAFRSSDGGATWQRADGVPAGVIAFKVAADPADPRIFYAATGAGLFRSTDAGATFTNVALPTSAACAGAPPDKRGCLLANMVTDVVVQGPANGQTAGARPGAVLAAVGWRAGHKTSQYGYVESLHEGFRGPLDRAAAGARPLDATARLPPARDLLDRGVVELGRPAFGPRALTIAFRLAEARPAEVTVERGGRVVKRFRSTAATRRVTLPARAAARRPPRRAARGRRGQDAHRDGTSIITVTGPSLTSSTSMRAPNTPRWASRRSQKRS